MTASRPRLTTEGMHSKRATQATFEFAPRAAAPATTIRMLIARWREEEMPLRRVAPGTAVLYKRALDKLEQAVGHCDVRGRFRHRVAAFHRDYPMSSAQQMAYLLGRLLRYACTVGLRTEPHDLDGVCSIKTQRRTRVFGLPERMRVFEWLHGECEHRVERAARDVVEFLLLSGWRPREAVSMAWEHVLDADEGTVFLPSTKAGPQTRTVGPEAMAVVLRQPKLGPWVFTGRSSSKHVHQATVGLVFARAREELGLHGCVLYTARSTFCTVAAQLSLHPSVIAAAVGHSTVFQQAVYCNPSPEMVRDGAAVVARKLVSK